MSVNEICRSPLFYVGDKYKLISEIKSLFPQHIKRFIEPFVGGASVSLNIEAESFVLNDLDTNVINLHKYLCSFAEKSDILFNNLYSLIEQYGLSCSYNGHIVPNELKQKFIKTYYAKYNKEGYFRLRDDFNAEGKIDMAKMYLLLIYGFNHMLRFNKKGEFNLPVGNVDFNSNVVKALNGYFSKMSYKSPQWTNLDFKDFLLSINWQSGDFIYLDPPYLITFSEYNKFWNQDTEEKLLSLLDLLHGKGCQFAISNVTHYKGKENTIFLSWAEKYKSNQIKSNYISYHDNSIKNFSEVLVTNY